MLQIALREQLPIWTEAPVTELIVDGANGDARVAGVVVAARRQARARAAPPRRADERRRLLAQRGDARALPARSRTRHEWTNANPGDTGEVIEMAMALGAAVDCMDEAWWVVTSLGPDGKPPRPGGYAADGTPLPFMHHLDLSMPYSMMVDQLGERFCDEAGAYMEIGQRMYRRQQETGKRGAELGRHGQPPARSTTPGARRSPARSRRNGSRAAT